MLRAALIILLSSNAYSSPLIVGIAGTIDTGIPTKVSTIKAALMSTGLEFDIRIYPGERSLQLLSQGEIALDVYRQPQAVHSYKNLIQIKPAVDVMKFWLVTHSSAAHLCDINVVEHSKDTVVGVRGVRLFSDYVYPQFIAHEEVNDFSQTLNMVADQRADFSVWPKSRIESELLSPSLNVHICDGKPYLTLEFYSYLHVDFSWALPVIEQAYKKHFKGD